MAPASTKKKLKHMSSLLIILGVMVLSGCRQTQPEVHSLLSFPETWEAAKNSDRLFCQYARKVAEETDTVREEVLSQFLASNRVSDVVLILEYANPVNLREYRMIVVTKRGAYHLSRFENGDTATCRIRVSVNELSEIRKCVGALHGYQSEYVIRKSAHSPCVLFATPYVKQKVTEMFFSDRPMLGVKRMVGTSRNPQYPTFRRLCDILLLAKGEDGVIPEFTIRQAEVQTVELGRKICSDGSRLF